MTPETALDGPLAAVAVAARELGRIVLELAEEASESVEAQPAGSVNPRRFEPGEWLDGYGRDVPDDDEPELEEPRPVLVPEPPGELAGHLDRRLLAIENRLAEVHKLADRCETRLDAQLGRVLELELLAGRVDALENRLESIGVDLRRRVQELERTLRDSAATAARTSGMLAASEEEGES